MTESERPRVLVGGDSREQRGPEFSVDVQLHKAASCANERFPCP
jgi:hypothetical protein